jgi:hypothetical protein
VTKSHSGSIPPDVRGLVLFSASSVHHILYLHVFAPAHNTFAFDVGEYTAKIYTTNQEQIK